MSGRDLPEVLSTIAVQARRTNLVRVGHLRAALQRSADAGLDAEGWSDAERTAHQLAGSAGTFGYAAASDLARQLEAVLAELADGATAAEGLDERTVPDSGRLAAAVDLLDRLTDQLSTEPELD